MEINATNLLILSSKISSKLEGFDAIFLNKKMNLTIKDKFLIFLLNGEKSPSELIELLGVAKTNLALISSELLINKLIQKQKDNLDKRLINYSLTPFGKQKADEIMKNINANIQNRMEYKNKNEEINSLAKELLLLLS